MSEKVLKVLIEEGTKTSDGGEMRVCQKCSTPFVFYNFPKEFENSAKKCPACIDKEQVRPSVIIERKILNEYSPVKVISLPGEWVMFETGYHSDQGIYRIDVSGKGYGASWSGRIVIYSNKIISVGDIIRIREMCSVHQVKKVRYNRPTMYHGTITKEQTVPLQSENEEAFESKEHRPYLVFEKIEADVTCDMNLNWITRYSKTTLKGYGRQYGYKIDTSLAIASWGIHGGARSGRLGTEGILAITSVENPIVITGSGDVEGEEIII